MKYSYCILPEELFRRIIDTSVKHNPLPCVGEHVNCVEHRCYVNGEMTLRPLVVLTTFLLAFCHLEAYKQSLIGFLCYLFDGALILETNQKYLSRLEKDSLLIYKQHTILAYIFLTLYINRFYELFSKI